MKLQLLQLVSLSDSPALQLERARLQLARAASASRGSYRRGPAEVTACRRARSGPRAGRGRAAASGRRAGSARARPRRRGARSGRTAAKHSAACAGSASASAIARGQANADSAATETPDENTGSTNCAASPSAIQPGARDDARRSSSARPRPARPPLKRPRAWPCARTSSGCSATLAARKKRSPISSRAGRPGHSQRHRSSHVGADRDLPRPRRAARRARARGSSRRSRRGRGRPREPAVHRDLRQARVAAPRAELAAEQGRAAARVRDDPRARSGSARPATCTARRARSPSSMRSTSLALLDAPAARGARARAGARRSARGPRDRCAPARCPGPAWRGTGSADLAAAAVR